MLKKLLSVCFISTMLTSAASAATWQNASDWATDELNKANETGIIPDILNDKDFTKLVSREEFAEIAVLVYENLSKTTVADAEENPFTDTTNPRILKAYKIGITSGVTETTFEPNKSLTREQAAVMLARAYSKAFNLENLPNFEMPESFADHSDISAYATDSVYFMNSKGYIKGTDKGFEPKGTCSREAALLIAARLAEGQAVADSEGSTENDAVTESGDTATEGENITEAALEEPIITNFYEDKTGALSLTFDDGDYSSGYFYNNELKKHKMKGTAMLIAGRLGSDYSSWRYILSQGYIDAGNHSMSHEIRYDEKPTAEELEEDITGSYELLKNYYPKQKVLTFATPWGRMSDEAEKEIAKNHYANRLAGGSVPNNPKKMDFMYLKSYIFNNSTAQEMSQWVEDAISSKGWSIILLHSCVAGEQSDGLNISQALFSKYLDYLDTKKDSVWIASFNEVVAYTKEARGANIEIAEEENKLTIKVTDELPDELFDHPLTMKVNINSDWTEVEAKQDKTDLKPTVYTENGKAYININIIPDGGDIVITSK